MPSGCEMIYTVKINRQKQAKISEYQQLEFLGPQTAYQKKKQPVKHKNIIFTIIYAILPILTAFDTSSIRLLAPGVGQKFYFFYFLRSFYWFYWFDWFHWFYWFYWFDLFDLV
jgi:hypothetical protein